MATVTDPRDIILAPVISSLLFLLIFSYFKLTSFIINRYA